MEDKSQILYQSLYDKGLYTKTYDEFMTQFADDTKRQNLHGVLSQKGLYTKTFEDFDGQFFSNIKKKEPTEPPTVGYELSSKYLQEDVSKEQEKSSVAPSPSVSEKLSPVEELAEKFYTEKGWPSPTKKMSEWQSGVDAINKEITDGVITNEDATKRVTELANKVGLSYDPNTGTASLYPNDIDIYKGQLDKAYIQTIESKSKTEKDSFFKDVLDNLNIGSHGVMTIPTRIMGVSERIGNAMIGLVDKDRNDATYWQDKASTDAILTDEWKANNARYDGTITELIQKGETGAAVGQTIMSVAENLPLLTTLALGNAAGATNLTLGLMGTDKAANEYLNSTSDPNMKEVTRIINAVGKGLSEVVFENIGTVSILNSVKKGIAKVGEQTIREQLIRSYTPYFQRQLSIAMKGASAMVREGGSEMATQLTDNLMSMAVGQDVKLGDGVGDAGIVGALIGGGLTAPQMIEEYKGGKSEFVKNIISNIPEDLEFEKKIELGELLIESAEIKYKQKQGIAGMDAVNKERLNTIQNSVAEILGVPLEKEGEAKTEPTVAEKTQVQETVSKALKTEEETKAEPLKKEAQVGYEGETKEPIDFGFADKFAMPEDEGMFEGEAIYRMTQSEYLDSVIKSELENKIGRTPTQEEIDAIKSDPNASAVKDAIAYHKKAVDQAEEEGKGGMVSEEILKDYPDLYEKWIGESLTKQPKVEEETKDAPTGEEVIPTSNDVINRDYRKLRDKLGEKKANKYFEQVDKIFNPNENNIIEYRANGVVTKEGDKYIFHAIADQELKTWRRFEGEGIDVTDQYVTPQTQSTEPKAIATNLGIEYIGEQPTDGGAPLNAFNVTINGEKHTINLPITATEEEVKQARDAKIAQVEAAPSDIEATIREIEAKELGQNVQVDVQPPTIEPKPEEVKEEEKTRKYEIGRKVVEDSTLSDDVKADLLDRGIEYVPRGAAYTDTEARELVSVYDSVEGGLDKLASMVYNVTNGILPDTRTKLNVHVADRYSKMLNDATTTEDRLKIRTKLADAFVFGQEQAKIAGQWVESQKAWKDILARDPEAIIVIKRRAQSKENKAVLENFDNDVKTSKQLLDELLNTEEFKQLIEEKVSDEINKIGTKKFGATDKKKIDDFFDSLLVKNDRAFDATIGIPIAVYNGAIVTIKKAVLAGVDLINAISQAVDYIDKWYKENYASGKITSPDWNKDDFSAQMRDKLKPLTHKVKKVKFKISKKAEQSIVDKIYSKMEVASKPQLRRLIQGYVAELEESGAVSDQKFKDLFAKAIGLDVLSTEDEQVIRLAGQSINHARKKADRLMEKFSEYFAEAQAETPDKAKLSQIEKEIEVAKSEEKKARLNARRAAQKLDDILSEESTLAQTVMKLVQAGLLTPISLVSNVIGNLSFIPFRGQASMVASALDSLVYGLSKAYTPLLKRVDIEKNPRLARLLKGLPEPKRVYNNFASVRGYGRGFVRGGIEGLRGMVEGQAPEDLQKREISKGLEPIKALLSFRDQLTGKEQIKFDKFFSNMLEMLPAGYMGEAMFRTLNLGDKPFRRAAENARLYEIAKLKGLSGKMREQFLINPDAETVSEMKKAGDIAVYQQDSIISDWIKNLDSYLKRSGADSRGREISTIAKTIVFLLRTTTAPYIKTPINLAMEAIEYSTPIYSLGRAIEKMTKGDRRGALNYMGKTIVGLEIMAIATWLIKEGLLTPPPDEDEKIRQAQYEGRGAYKINLTALNRRLSGGSSEWQEGDSTWSVQRFGVLSMILMGISKAYEDTPVTEMAEMNMLQRNIAMMPSILAGSLDQAFLSGTSTALQAILEGGPAMDKWLVSSSRALSAVVYPNVLGQVSQTFFDDNYIKEVRDMYDEEKALGRQIKNTLKDRMFMGKDLPNKISIWGEPVLRVPEGRNWPYMIFDTRKETKYQKSSFGVKMWEFYDRYRFVDEDRAKDILPAPPNAKTEVGWDSRNMTTQEVEQLLTNIGKRRKSYVEHFMNSTEYEAMSDEERIDELQKIYREASSQVKAQMFMLNHLEKGYPELWKLMYDNNIVPIPTKTVSFKVAGKDVKLKEEEAAEYYDIVQRYFGEMASGIVDSFKDKELNDKELEILRERLDKIWLKAKNSSEKIYYKNLKTE